MKESLKAILNKIVSRDTTTTKDLNAFDKFIHYRQSNFQMPTQERGNRIWASIENEVRHKGRVIDFRMWLKIAASVLIIISVGTAYYFGRSSDKGRNLMTITATNGEKKTVKLADGSMVKLNSGSSLSFPKKFEESKREVVLKGEAFFDVARDENSPFLIITENLTTTVLGTSFNIQSYPEDSAISVTVASGKVQIQPANSTQNAEILMPGQQGIFHKQSSSITKAVVKLDRYLAWQENILLFEDAPLIEVTKTLERWYDVEIDLSETTGVGCRIEGSYKSEKLVNVLESLKFLGVLDYKFKDDKKIELIGKPCKD
jgi:transmembrane sensor